jgi:DNA replication protein DnaC
MKKVNTELSTATIKNLCKQLRLPSIAAEFERMAEEAVKEHRSYMSYLEALLIAEVEEREKKVIERRIKEAKLPIKKTLEEFEYWSGVRVKATQIASLAEGGYVERKEPVILIGDSGTGKTHIASGLCIAACKQKRRCRYTTATGLINELAEAQSQSQLKKALSRWSKYELIVIDEVGYVPIAEVGAELMFQVISERVERASIIMTTNLPFSEWTSVFSNTRLCKAIVDRVTDRAHIVETGTESYRFKRTMERKKKEK